MSPRSCIKLLSLALLGALGACASQPAAVPVPVPVPQVVQKPQQPNCLRETGSRLPPGEGRCLPVAGRVLLNEDLQRTGAVSAGEAVRRLIP